jgi:hypothetical protein
MLLSTKKYNDLLGIPESVTALTGFPFQGLLRRFLLGDFPKSWHDPHATVTLASCSLKISVKLRSLSAPLLWLCQLGVRPAYCAGAIGCTPVKASKAGQ